MAENNYILEIEGLSKAFGRNQVLKNIDLRVRKGTVMGLMGENGAGKSTMMKCLFGIYERDTGIFKLDGKNIDFVSARDALDHGVAMVHQELNQCLDRSIQDNIFLGKYVTRFGICSESEMHNRAVALFNDLGMNFDPHTIMRTMSVSQRQMVEIAKAVSYNSKIIILDEPTSSLSEREVKKLFDIIRRLKKTKGVSFIFISHKMDEIFELCDDITILRDGAVTLDKEVKDSNLDELITAMVGRSLDSRFPPMTNKPSDKDILIVRGLEAKYKPYIKDVSFTLKKGEILGIYGLVGAGRSEVLELLFGVRTIAGGEIFYNSKRILFQSSKEAMENNFAMVTEERKTNGMFAKGDLIFNTCITNISHYMKFKVLSNLKMRDATKIELDQMHVKCNGPEDSITALSGGNQQKVIIGKWLERAPTILLMDEPTRGIDILAKYQIYELMIKLASEGKSIIMVSSEMPEILGVTNRIMVMSNYRMAGIVNTKETNQEELLSLCAKYL